MKRFQQISINSLFKYRPRNSCDEINQQLCPTELVGKILRIPPRTIFKKGIYLTSFASCYTRYLEDVLSIGYTPYGRCRIVLGRNQQGLVLVNNEDNCLGPLSRTQFDANQIMRVWPAFGQIGGASEFIAVTDEEYNLGENEPQTVQNDAETANCLHCVVDCNMPAASRFQIFSADSVTRPIDILTYLSLIRSFRTPGSFLEDSIFRSDDETIGFFKFSSSGLVIKFARIQTTPPPGISTMEFTLSAGITWADNLLYVYVMGSVWSDEVKGNETYRTLYTTRPVVFHVNPNRDFHILLNRAVNKVIGDVKNNEYLTRCRRVKIPSL